MRSYSVLLYRLTKRGSIDFHGQSTDKCTIDIFV